MTGVVLAVAAALAWPAAVAEKAFDGRAGALVVIEAGTGAVYRSDAARCAEKLAPCSTFKIWNTAIGLELGEIAGADDLFWKWDGKRRFLDDWNKDQTLRSAFAVSCVPAYQALARRTGPERMKAWLEKIGYGDRDISAGVDVFWLPAAGRKTLLISADQQAEMMRRLVEGELPFSAKTRAELKEVMRVVKTERGILYGKTGSSGADAGSYGWFVGSVESKGKTYVFACWLKGEGVMGRDARSVVERVLGAEGLL